MEGMGGGGGLGGEETAGASVGHVSVNDGGQGKRRNKAWEA